MNQQEIEFKNKLQRTKNIVTGSAVNREQWRKLEQQSNNLSPFHSEEFYNFSNLSSSQEANVFAVSDNEGIQALAVVCLMKGSGLKGFFSRRAIIYDMPLFTDETSLTYLLNHIDKYTKSRSIYTEIRNYSKIDGQPAELLKGQNWNYLDYMNVNIPVDGNSSEDVLLKMDSERRRQIRKSMKEGALCEIAENETEVTGLYEILKELYTSRVKVPIPDLDYFINLHNSEIGKVFIIKHNGNIIGGSFCLFSPEKAIYTLYYCGLKDYSKKIRPTNLAVYGIINFAISNKLKAVDLMGAGRKHEKYGVRYFKQAFGGEFFESGRFIKINSKLLYNLGKKVLQLKQRTKK